MKKTWKDKKGHKRSWKDLDVLGGTWNYLKGHKKTWYDLGGPECWECDRQTDKASTREACAFKNEEIKLGGIT